MPSSNLRSGASNHDYAAAWHLFVAGDTLDGISQKLDIPYSTLAAYASRHKWREMRQKALDVAKKAIKHDLATRLEKHKTSHQHFILDQLEHTQAHIEQLEIGDDKDAGQVGIGQKLSLIQQHDNIARRTLKLDEDQNNDPVAFGFAVLRQMQQLARTPSAMETLPDNPEASAGILGPFNGQQNGPMPLPESAEKGQIIDIEPATGPTKSLPPTLSFKPPTPKPLVNESEEQQDGNSTGSSPATE